MENQNAITVPINLDASGMAAGINQAVSSISQLEKTMTGYMEKIESNTGGIMARLSQLSMITAGVQNLWGAWSGTINGLVGSFTALGDSLSKASQRTGISADSLGGLKFAAEQCGGNFDLLINSIRTFSNTLGAAKLGDAGAIGKLSKVGLNADMFDGKDAEKQFGQIADYIASITDPAQQARVAMELFGEAGYKLLPMLQEGAAGIHTLAEEGKTIGAVMGEDATNGAVALADAVNRMKTSVASITNNIMTTLAPAMEKMLTLCAKEVQGILKIVNENKTLIVGITTFVGILGGAQMAWTAFGIAAAKIPPVITAISLAVKGLTTAMMTNPFIACGVAVAAVVAAVVALNSGIKETKIALAELDTSADGDRDKLDRRHEDYVKKIERLKTLQSRGPLTRQEMNEADTLLNEVNSEYGVELGRYSKDGSLVLDQGEGYKINNVQAGRQLDVISAQLTQNRDNQQNLEAERDAWQGKLNSAKTQQESDKALDNRTRIEAQISELKKKELALQKETVAIMDADVPISRNKATKTQKSEEMAAASDKAREKKDAQDKKKDAQDKKNNAARANADKEEQDRIAGNLNDNFYDHLYGGDEIEPAGTAPDAQRQKNDENRAAIESWERDIENKLLGTGPEDDIYTIETLKKELEKAKDEYAKSNVVVVKRDLDEAKKQLQDKQNWQDENDLNPEVSDLSKQENQKAIDEAQKKVNELTATYNQAKGAAILAKEKEQQKAVDTTMAKFQSVSTQGSFSSFRFSQLGGADSPEVKAVKSLTSVVKTIIQKMDEVNVGLI